ncbi:hypothetical protein A8L48_12485 [Rhizobium rhizogenes]|nr:hypothetical protein A8L48_12485 [Rhizobium rhizogenes]
MISIKQDLSCHLGQRECGETIPAQECEEEYGAGGCRIFFLPEGGGRSRQRDEGVTVEINRELAPSSDPSGHLLPLGEKKRVATLRAK